jgi:hypothetical protein
LISRFLFLHKITRTWCRFLFFLLPLLLFSLGLDRLTNTVRSLRFWLVPWIWNSNRENAKAAINPTRRTLSS